MKEIRLLNSLAAGDMRVNYWLEETAGKVSLQLLPESVADNLPVHRRDVHADPAVAELVEAWGMRVQSFSLDSLVQVRCIGDAGGLGFHAGRTMREGQEQCWLRYAGQQQEGQGIVTVLDHANGLRAFHELTFASDEPYVVVRTELENRGDNPVTVEMASSFCLAGISPLHEAEGHGAYRMHRFRSDWCAEGRHEVQALESLNMERPFVPNSNRGVRFGQIGTLPCRDYFPTVLIEDQTHDIFWGASLAWMGSWQLEVFRRDDFVSISGGLADREFGHWFKTLRPDETLALPAAILSTCAGDVDRITQRLTAYQRRVFNNLPETEHDLPIQFNNWCTHWGEPAPEKLLAIADRLVGSRTRYFVIDDGWFRDGPGEKRCLGDWLPSRVRYPNGLASVTGALRDRGFVPGLWFEFETCMENSTTYERTDLLLRRDSIPYESGWKRFLDFRNPATHDFLRQRVSGLLKDAGFGYIKIDCNDCVAVGVDGAESPGEGLRQHVIGVQEFISGLRREQPELVIENCASGGHRLEPSTMALVSVGSATDAAGVPETPIIAANLHRLIQPRQSLIWAVLRETDSVRTIIYKLAACFLGRFVFSGDIVELRKEQMEALHAAQALYEKVAPIIRDGFSCRLGEGGTSLRNPEGWQAVFRVKDDGTEGLLVLHTFNMCPRQIVVRPPTGDHWRANASLVADGLQVSVEKQGIVLDGLEDLSAVVIHLVRHPVKPLRPKTPAYAGKKTRARLAADAGE